MILFLNFLFYNKFIILFQQLDNNKIIIFIFENIEFYYIVSHVKSYLKI